MLNPKVSILMASWNRAHLISRAVESALSQSFQDWELIIVDDGSSDNTSEAVKRWQEKDARIKYFYSEHTGRICKVSNFGLRRARGQYIAILDDDDAWANPDKLKIQVEFLDKNSDYVGCGGGFIVIDEKGREKLRFLKPEKDENIKLRALMANPMANSTTLFRYDAAKKVGFYDETLLQFADWDFWLKMGLIGKLYNFPRYFAYYQMSEKGSSFKKEKENAVSALKIVQRYKNKYLGFGRAILLAYIYYCYTLLPGFLRKFLNPILSQFKKLIFSSRKK